VLWFAPAFLGLCGQLAAQPITVWDLGPIEEAGLFEQPFALARDATIRIEAVGAGPKDLSELHTYGWILDASTRLPVFTMTKANTRETRRSEDRAFDGQITLPKGKYIAYFSALGRHYEGRRSLRFWKYDIGHFRALTGQFFAWDAFGDPETWGMRLTITDRNFPPRDLLGFDGEVPSGAVIDFAPLEHNTFETQAFEVNRPVHIEIRAVAEYDATRNDYADRSWLTRARSGEVLWETRKADATPAGGAPKNHAFRRALTLEPGTYVFGALTDDSHAAGDWNEAPPLDPAAWGARVFVDPSERDAIHFVRGLGDSNVLARIDRVRNSSFVRSAFALDRSVPVRILAQGEAHYQDRDFADYGWIERLPDRTIVWTMRGRDSEDAGGHPKNRRIQADLTLSPGTYVLSYVTDDSHAYGAWNASPPNDPAAWGITLFARDSTSAALATPVDLKTADPAIISLIATGDNIHRKQTMTLTRPYRLRILALGEGLDGKMYDHGWIEEVETGKTVWSMDYASTRPAGGDPKNRLEEATVDLPAGRYRVHYRSDDSHSFEEWNASPPDRPELWGISIYVDEDALVRDVSP